MKSIKNYIIFLFLLIILTNCKNEIDYIYKTGDFSKKIQPNVTLSKTKSIDTILSEYDAIYIGFKKAIKEGYFSIFLDMYKKNPELANIKIDRIILIEDYFASKKGEKEYFYVIFGSIQPNKCIGYATMEAKTGDFLSSSDLSETRKDYYSFITNEEIKNFVKQNYSLDVDIYNKKVIPAQYFGFYGSEKNNWFYEVEIYPYIKTNTGEHNKIYVYPYKVYNSYKTDFSKTKSNILFGDCITGHIKIKNWFFIANNPTLTKNIIGNYKKKTKLSPID